MSDFDSLVISSATLDDFSDACHKVTEALPKEPKIRLGRILIYCVQRYGNEGAYKRLNNRSVAQIFADYPAVELKDILEPEDLKLITSGKVEGMRYELYDAPSPPSDEDSDRQS